MNRLGHDKVRDNYTLLADGKPPLYVEVNGRRIIESSRRFPDLVVTNWDNYYYDHHGIQISVVGRLK